MRRAVGGHALAVEVGLEPAERLAREDVEADGDQRAVRRVEDLVRLRDADQLVGAAAAGVVDRHHLDVLGEGVVDLAVARDDVPLEVVDVELRSAGELVHPGHQLREGVGHDEVDAVLLERLHRAGRALRQPALGEELQVLAGDVGVLLGAGERELLLDDRLGEHEPRVVVAGGQDLLHRADRVRARDARHALEPPAGGVEPHRRRAGQDPDGVVRPHRVPVVDALDVGPHPVLVDHRRAGVLGDALHPSVDVGGDAGDHVLGRGADALGGPVAPHQLVVVADAAGGDDDRRCAELEGRRPRRGWTSRRARRRRRRARCRARPRPRRPRRPARRPGGGTRGVRAPAPRHARPARRRSAPPRGRCPTSGGSAGPSCRGRWPGRPRARPTRRRGATRRPRARR